MDKSNNNLLSTDPINIYEYGTTNYCVGKKEEIRTESDINNKRDFTFDTADIIVRVIDGHYPNTIEYMNSYSA